MQIVIDIPEYLYTNIKDIRNVDRTEVSLLCNAVINGIVLPKGHGIEITKDGEIIEKS